MSRRTAPSSGVWSGLALVALAVAVCGVPSLQAQSQARFLGREEIVLYGLGLQVQPAQQTVPKGFATIVSTYLQTPQLPGTLPPFAPDAEVRATLRGPSFEQPLELVAKPNSPLNVPILTVPGTHTVENIRLVSGKEVLLYGSPQSVRIDVIEKLLVTTVTARPLTADEIREKGIVFDRSNYQAYNFTAAFAVEDGKQINVSFPVVLPTLAAPSNVDVSSAGLTLVEPPMLRDIATIIPDTLRIQSRIPNLSVTGFTLTLSSTAQGQDLYMPPIPGVIVIPGDIGFLNQYFSVMLMVANVAPTGSNLVVSNLSAAIVLPPGNDSVVGSDDDPLRMAQIATGGSPRVQLVRQPGPDGKLGTGDDLTTLGPGETGSAEYLIEGRREGTWAVEMEMSGTLTGMPVGPVSIRGRAAGSVLVRNPKFTLTFTHPEVVNAGEPYTLDVTVTNTSDSPANVVSVNLFGQHVSGARLNDDPTKTIDSIAPGDSSSVTYHLISQRTGRVTAATLDSDDNVAGQFALKTGVGEFGIPLSPDSLVLPKEAGSLPQALRDATLGLLGRAWAVATAPPAAFPKNLTRFSKQVVLDRAVETAEAGFRTSLGEPLPMSAANLLMDVLGSEYPRLGDKVPANDTTGLLALLQRDVQGFDLLRRLSFRGDVFADQIAAAMTPAVGADPMTFHRSITEQFTSRPGHLSVLVSTANGLPLPVDAVLVDAAGRRLGGLDGTKTVKEIPFGDVLTFVSGAATTGKWLMVAVPEAGAFTVRLARSAGADPAAAYSVSVAYPGADGRLRFASFGDVGATDVPVIDPAPAAGDPYAVTFELTGVSTLTPKTGAPALVTDPAPTVLGAVQMAEADIVGCQQADSVVRWHGGRVVAVLFSEEVTAASVQDKLRADQITAFSVPDNRVVGVALQPGRRIAFVALREPVGRFVERTITIQGVGDTTGHALASATLPITMTVTTEAGVVSGQVLNAAGTPAAFSEVRLFYEFKCDEDPVVLGIASQNADAQGRYQFDYVLLPPTVKLVALDPTTDDIRIQRFKVARDSQRLNVNIVFIGRGTINGRTLAESGTPLANSKIRITSLTDQSQYGATSDAQGRFEIQRVPVGNIVVEAVNTDHPAQIVISERIPVAGATMTRDLVLLDVDLTGITVKTGSVTGSVMRSDGVTPVEGVPVVAYYRNRSQTGVRCPPPPPPFGGGGEPEECAIAVANTGSGGVFSFPRITAGELRLTSFDQAALQEGQVRVTLAENQTVTFNLLLGGGFGTVTGVVIDQDGRPVPDAEVGGGLSVTKVNPADGRFTLTDVPVGRREMVAVSQAMASTGRTTVDIVRQGEVVNATIVLDIVGAVAGRVFDHDGVPQAGINVYVIQDCYDDAGNDAVCVRGQATTGVNGAYRVNGMLAGRYRVSAFRANMRDGNIVPFAIRYQGQVLSVDVTFRGGGGTVSGRVLRAKPTACVEGDPTCVETPLAARVAISGDQLVVGGGKIGVRFEYVQNFQIVDNNVTSGAFSFSNLWAGPFTVRAAGQFSPEPVAVEGTMPGPGQTVNVDLRLQPTSRINGTVYESDGVTPVIGRQVSLKFTSNAVVVFCHDDATTGESNCVSIPQGIQEEFAVTDTATGQFSFPIVNAGAFTITASDLVGSRVAEVRGSVKAGETVDLGVRLLARGRVTIQVIRHDGHTLVPGASVRLQQIDYPKTDLSGVAVDGTITWESLGESQFVVLAKDANGFGGRASGRIVHDGDDVTVIVYLYDATGTAVGLVTRLDDQSAPVPVPNAEVVLTNGSGPIAFALTDADGRYSVSLVPLGTFVVDGFDPVTAGRGRATGSVTGGSQDVVADIRLDALGIIRGVLLESGTLAPLKGWQITLWQATPSGRGLPTLTTTTSVDGSFSFPGASVGSFSLNASHRGIVGEGSASGQVSRAGQLVEVQVVATIVRRVTGRVTGLVANPNGTPAPDAQVEICSVEPCRPTTAGADGRFSLEDVPLGRFTVRASAQVTGAPSVGTAGGSVLFENDVADVTVTLLGLSVVDGTVFEVVNNMRTPAAYASVRLYGQPGSGCSGPCLQNADASGRFHFVNVPARTFTVAASSAVDGASRQGSVGGVLNPGETKSGLEVVLEPAVSLSGRVLLSTGTPAAGIVAELTTAGTRLYAESGPDGLFIFQAVKAGAYALRLQDPVGPGIAKKSGTVDTSAVITLGDITLDETPPAVGQMTPADGTINVSLAPEIRVTFTEAISRGTVNDSTIQLVGPSGAVTGEVTVPDGTGDTVALFRLLGASQLASQARYSVRVSGVEDRLGKTMVGQTVATFTTMDITPPSILETTPAASTTGVTIDTVVRVKFSEVIDATKFSGPAIVVGGPAGSIEGRVEIILASTVAVFTPTRPLLQDTVYTVSVAAATDLTGLHSSVSTFSFATTDGTPPQVVSLTASNGGRVIENTTSQVTATVSAGDVAFVDFFINDVFINTDRTPPLFAMTFQALPAYGVPGGTIRVSAVATDTSGNRGALVSSLVAVDADHAPAAVIDVPAPGTTVTNNQVVQVRVHGTDDVGVNRLGFKATLGSTVLAALSSAVTPATDRTANFSFGVPGTAAPGSPIVIEASAADTKGQMTAAAPVTLIVVDTTGPTVAITAPFTGSIVQAGAVVTAVVTANDPGGVASIGFRPVGIAAETVRVVSPTQKSVVTSFSFTVPANAEAGSTITLSAFAVDATTPAGNRSNAGAVLLTVADAAKPTTTLRTATGSADMVRGRQVSIDVTGNDNIAVSTLTLTGTGAFAFSSAFTVPGPTPTPTATHRFTLDVPVDVPDGAIEVLTARATDWSSNQSTPVTLTLTARPIVEVILPLSVLVNAGDTQTISVGLRVPATSSVTVQLQSAAPGVATVTPSVTFAVGETSKTATVTGVSDGNAEIDAYVSTWQRASTLVTVSGGIVHGTVVDGNLQPVSGAQVTVFHSGAPIAKTTNSDGTFDVEGVVGYGGGRGFTVQATDGERLGKDDAQLDVPGGSATVTIIILPLSVIHGTVFLPGGVSPVAAGSGVQVDLYEASQPTVVLHTTWTNDQGAFEFRLVAQGSYGLVASDTAGNRGSGTAAVTGGGQSVAANITFLGKGTVTGLVQAAGAPVTNASVELRSNTVFGQVTRTTTVGSDGRFTFEQVFVGSFSVTASVANTNQGGSTSGSITTPGQTVDVVVQLSWFGDLQGTVFRSDESTKVPGASVSVVVAGGTYATATDNDGHYSFSFLPFGTTFTVSVYDPGTRAMGRVIGGFTTSGQTVTKDVVLMPQGTVIVTVISSASVPVNDASVHVTVQNSGLADNVSGQSGPVNGVDGQLVLTRLLAGAFTATASKNGLSGWTTGTIVADQQTLVTIQLEAPAPTGAIVGHVFEPNGQPAVTGSVRASGPAGTYYAAILTDGAFDLQGVRLGAYRLDAFDANGWFRAFTTGVVIAGNGESQSRDLVLVGLGTVKGMVTNAFGVASDLPVTLHSSNPTFGRDFGVTTGAAGQYEIGGVPVGGFTVSASGGGSFRAEAGGAIDLYDQVVTVNLALEANTFTNDWWLYDGNNSSYAMLASGEMVLGGVANIFGAGAARLDIIQNGTTLHFSGGSYGTSQDGGRETVGRQSGLHGLNVTRKFFVPGNGYFARVLETLTNPTTADITVDVVLTSNMAPWNNSASALIPRATSSGNTAIEIGEGGVRDHWVVMDDYGNDVDAYSAVGFGVPVSFVFDGVNALKPVSAVSVPPAGNQVEYRWEGLTVPAAGTVTLMHFVAQQVNRNGAVESAQRLVGLPPEALSGLGGDEIASIVNFVVPQDGIGTLAPLPALTGVVSGTVFEGDGVTKVPGAVVFFRSTQPLFGRVWAATADGAGAYAFTGGPGQSVPLDHGFELRAKHPVDTATFSPFYNLTFAPGETTAVQDIVFSATGFVSGTVRRTGGALVTSGAVTVTQGATTMASVPIGADGTYTVGALPPASYGVTATTTHPQGSGLVSPPATVVITAGQVTVADLTTEPTGRLQGIVYDAAHAPVASTRVEWFRLNQSGGYAFYRADDTDALGRFASDDMPVGSYTLRTYAPPTNLAVTTAIDIAADVTALPVLQYPVPGTLTVHVQRTNGLALGGIKVYVHGDGWGSALSDHTNATGDVVFADMRTGEAISAQAVDEGYSYLYTQGAITLATATGGSGTLTLAMPPFGTVTGTVYQSDGTTPMPGTKADLALSWPGQYQQKATDGTSGFSFDRIPAGAVLTLRTTDTRTPPYFSRAVTATIQNDGEVLTVPLRVPAVGRVVVTVMNPDGTTPMPNAAVRLWDNYYTYNNYCVGNPGTPATTGADGVRVFANVPEGPFTVALLSSAHPPSCSGGGYYDKYVEKVTGQVTQSGGNVVVNLVPRTYSGVTITGVITAADGVTPIPDWSEVYIYRATERYLTLGQVTTDVNGRFSLPNQTVTGAGVVIMVRSPGLTGNLPDVAVPMPEAGGTLLDVGTLTIPVRKATVRGRVLASDGTTPITPAYSAAEYTITYDNNLASAPVVDGSYEFPERWIALEGARVRVWVPGAPNGVITATTGPITANGQVITLDLVLPASIYASVAGQVVASGNLATPIYGASVELLRANGDSLSDASSTDRDGRFSWTVALPADGRFKVRAHSPMNWDVSAEVNGQATLQAQQVDVGILALPISVVAGAVTYDDGQPVANASIFALLPDGSTQWATFEAGRYRFYSLPTGVVALTAQDGDTGLTTNRTVTLDSATSVLTVDLRMPPTGMVVATVVDDAGNRVIDATLALVSDKLYFEPRIGPWENVHPNGEGQYVFSRVPAGSVYLQARRDGCDGSCQLYTSGTGMLVNAGDTLTMQVGFQGFGPVTGQVLNAAGIPLTGRAITIDIDAYGAGGPMGHYQRQLHRGVDAQGPYIADDLPPGPVQVRVSVDGTDEVGVADGVVAVATNPQEPPVLTLDVRLGTAARFVDWNGLPLDGSDGFRYFVNDTGAVYGSRTDDTLSGTLSNAVTFAFGENQLCCAPLARPESVGRQLVLGPMVQDGASGMLHVIRKVYVPADGRFARHLDTLTNPTSVPLTREIRLSSEKVTDLIELTQPSATAAGIARLAGGACGWSGDCGTSAYVFSGVNPPNPPTRVWIQQWTWHSQEFGYAWTVTVPPNSSVSLLHFVTMGLPDEADAVALRAARLAALTEPGALDGLTEEELAAIVNFALPGGRTASVSGTLLASDGSSAIAGQRIDIIETVGGQVLRSLVSGPDGRFAADNLLTRDRLTIRAYVMGLPGGWIDVDPGPVVSGQPLAKDVGLPASVYARLEGSVKALDGAKVLVLRPGPGTREVLAETSANVNGVFGMGVALPADGMFILRAESPTGSGTGWEVPLEMHQQNGLVVDDDHLVLPVSAMIGAVTHGDLTPVVNPTVFARHTDGTTTFATRSRADGSFAFYELPAGEYRLTAQDPTSGLTAELSGPVTLATDLSHSFYNDWALPLTGTVIVTPSSTELTGAPTLALVSNNVSFEQWVGPDSAVKPDANGRYVFQHVPLGAFYVQGKWTVCIAADPCRTLWASASGSLDSASTPRELALPFDPHGDVQVNVLNRTSGVKVLIVVDALGSAGPIGQATMAVELDVDTFRFSDIPPGQVRVFVRQEGLAGLSYGLLPVPAVPGTPSELGIAASLGSAREFPTTGPDAGIINIWGSDILAYPFDGAGRIVAGGYFDAPRTTGLGKTLKNAGALYVNDNVVCCRPAVGWDDTLSGRQATFGPMVSHRVGGLMVTRKLYVPDVGGFARFLDVLSNQAGMPVTVEVRIGATIEGAQPDEHGVVERGVVERGDPSATGGYAVIGGVQDKYGASAYVYSGVNPPTAPLAASFDFGRTNEARVEWRLTLQPGQSVALLHFVIQRLPGDVTGAGDRARSLAGSQFVNALVGLTDGEKASIINFRF